MAQPTEPNTCRACGRHRPTADDYSVTAPYAVAIQSHNADSLVSFDSPLALSGILADALAPGYAVAPRSWCDGMTHVWQVETAPLCGAIQTVPVGYDETVEAFCTAPKGHAGAHAWTAA